MPHAAGFVRDTRAFAGTLFSRQEAIRFIGIALDLAMAGRLEFKWLERQRINPTYFETLSPPI
jgi:hypothetical protein